MNTPDKDKDGKKNALSGDIWTEALKRYKYESTLILILFLVFVLTIINESDQLPPAVRPFLLTTLIIGAVILAATLLYVNALREQKRRTTGTAQQQRIDVLRERLMAGGVGIAAVLMILLAHYTGMFATVLPGAYLVQSGQATIRRNLDSLNRMLVARSDAELVGAWHDYLSTYTMQKQNKFFAVGARQSKLFDDGELLDNNLAALRTSLRPQDEAAVARAYTQLFKGISQCQLVNLQFDPRRSGGGQNTYFVLCEQSGEFVLDDFRDITLGYLASAVLEPTSEQRAAVNRLFYTLFPKANSDLMWDQAMFVPLGQLRNCNEPERLLYRSDQYGCLTPTAFKQAQQIELGHWMLEPHPSARGLKELFSNPMRIQDQGQWMTKRVTRQPPEEYQVMPPPLTPAEEDRMAPRPGELAVSIRVSVPYRRQESPVLCQSAALLMAALHCDPAFAGTQDSVRAELTQLGGGDPLAHDARLLWLQQHCQTLDWSSEYNESLRTTYETLLNCLNSGHPAVMSTRLTNAGHVVVVTGVGQDARGQYFVEALDPNGKFGFVTQQFIATAGQPVYYYLDRLAVKTLIWRKGEDTKVAIYNSGSGTWRTADGLAPLQLRTEGFMPDAQWKRDWEFIAPAVR